MLNLSLSTFWIILSLFFFSYRKFTRGKDLSQYSAVDLGCILGTQRKDIRKALKEDIVDSNTLNQDDQEVKRKADNEREKTEKERSDESSESSNENEKTEDKDKLDANGKLKSNFLTLNRGSMNDYFEQKMAAMKLRLAGNVATPTVKVEVDEEEVLDVKSEKEKRKKEKRRLAAAKEAEKIG